MTCATPLALTNAPAPILTRTITPAAPVDTEPCPRNRMLTVPIADAKL